MSKITNNPFEIRKWAEERGGKPAINPLSGLPQITFGESYYQEVSWEEYFEILKSNQLELLIQDEGDSNFYRVISSDSHY